MTISYPVSMPTNVGLAEISLTTRNAVAVSMSPFTYKQQTQTYDGQMWEAECTLPPLNRDDAQAWVAFLMSLKGRANTFLLYDPSSRTLQSSNRPTSATVAGSAGSSTLSVTMSGTITAGDYIQIGTASDATLHKVLETVTNNGTMEIWPKLRKARTSANTVVLTDASGVFRLSSNETSWSVNNASFFGISFGATEVVL
jgi:hypothetical protein